MPAAVLTTACQRRRATVGRQSDRGVIHSHDVTNFIVLISITYPCIIYYFIK